MGISSVFYCIECRDLLVVLCFMYLASLFWRIEKRERGVEEVSKANVATRNGGNNRTLCGM